MQLVWLLITASTLLLAVAGLTSACTAEEADAAAAPLLFPRESPAARCRLRIVGDYQAVGVPSHDVYGNIITLRNGTIKSATIICTGGPVHIAIDEGLLGPHKAGFVGVKLDGTCISAGCLLTVCGRTRVSIVDSNIWGITTQLPLAPNVRLPCDVFDTTRSNTSHGYDYDGVNNVHVALCIKDSAHVVLHNTSILHGNVSGVLASGHTRLLLNASKVANNTGGALPAGMTAMGSATVVVTHGSAIEGNQRREGPRLRYLICLLRGDLPRQEVPRSQPAFPPVALGGGLGVFDRAQVHISGTSSVCNNTCWDCYGVGVAVSGTSRVVVSGCSHVDGNLALQEANYGGMYVSGQATLVLRGHSKVLENFKGGVCADGNSSVTISGGSVVANNTVTMVEDGSALRVVQHADVRVIGPVHISDMESSRGLELNAAFGLATTLVSVADNASLSLVGGVVLNSTDTTMHAVLLNDQANLHVGPHVTHQGQPLTKCSGTIRLKRLQCRAGEINARAGDFCQCCPPSTYSLEVNASCAACPLNAVCPGGDVVWPVAGYWHSSKYSVQMHKCPLSTTSCGEQGVCRQGYSGNLCGACAAGYGLASPLRCRPCGSGRHQLLLFVMLFLVCVVIISYTVHATWQDNRAGDSALRPSDVIKVLVQFLQYLVILGSVSVPWPSFLTDCFTAASTVFTVASGHNSLDCLLKQRHHGVGVPVAYLRQLFYLLVAPAAVLVAVMLVVVLSRCAAYLWSDFACSGRDRMRRAPFSWQLLGRLRVAALVVAFYAYPTLVKAALTFFACLPIDYAAQSPHAQYAIRNHTAGYWVMDIQQECFTGSHRQWALGLGVPAVIVLCLGVPVALFLMLWCNTENTFNKAFQQHYGFLYRNYADSKVWWEAVWAVQTVLLTAVSVFHFSIRAYYSLLLMMLILVLSAALQFVARPYIHTRLHRMHMAATCCLCLSVWLALTLFTMEFDIMALRPVHTAAGSLIVAVNVVFVACCSYMILHLAHPTIVKGVLAAVAWFTECCRCGPKHARPGGAPSPQ